MSSEELKQVGARIAERLGSYPMLITILILVAATVFFFYTDNTRTTESITKLVFGQMEWLQQQNDKLIEHILGE